ncbi:MAG: hypothetical protein ACEPO8_03185 [Rhodothermaceae bacterium]
MSDISRQWLEEVQTEMFDLDECPEYDLLVKYSGRKMSKSFNHHIETHLSNCELCSSVVNSLSCADTNKIVEKSSEEIISSIERSYSKNSALTDKIKYNLKDLYSLIFGSPAFKYSFSTVLVLIIAGFVSHQLLKPEYYELARINPTEKEMIMLSVENLRGEKEIKKTSSDISFLLENETSFLGFIPNFNEIKLNHSLKILTSAFNSNTDSFYKEKYAYFIGKTYLMKNDIKSAVDWFTKVTDSKSETMYSKLAGKILSELK